MRTIKNVSSELNYKSYGFTEADLEKEFTIKTENNQGIFAQQEKWKLGELILKLNEIYGECMGIERAHITDEVVTNWLINKMEEDSSKSILTEDKKKFFEGLQYASLFEEFLTKKFTNTKRFSLSGCETLTPLLKLIMDRAIEQGAEKIVLGMTHRGRLNVMAYVLHKKIEDILAGFIGIVPQSDEIAWGKMGDVKYHLGYMHKYTNAEGKTIEVLLMSNASHLESADPITMGRVRAEQDIIGDSSEKKVIAIVVHGDAGISGQGIVYETLQLSGLEGYKIGGTIHIVVNNQIGFTTVPSDSRTGTYCTEIAKAIYAPIFHVNSEDPESIIKAGKIATDYKYKFSKDVMIDLVGYRLYGHNEMDQPMFTQPLMYKKIQNMKRIYDKVVDSFISEGLYTKEEINKLAEGVMKGFEEGFGKLKGYKIKWEEWAPKVSDRLPSDKMKKTGVSIDLLKDLSEKINVIPKGFVAHPIVSKVYETRYKSVKDGVGIDWGTGESLAWATLLSEGHNIRLSGQDAQRGTFSHRHAYIHNQEKDEVYVPLQNISKKQGKFNVINSTLSEIAALGFEIGYQYADPNALVMWEAQFGDFANGGQVMIDQYLSSAEANGVCKAVFRCYFLMDTMAKEQSIAVLD